MPTAITSAFIAYTAWIWSFTVTRPSLNRSYRGKQFTQPAPGVSVPSYRCVLLHPKVWLPFLACAPSCCLTKVSFYVNSLTFALTPVSAGGYPPWLRRFGTHVLLSATKWKWVAPFLMSPVPFYGVRMPMSPQWPTVSTECDPLEPDEALQTRIPRLRRADGWTAEIYQGEPLREHTSLRSGQPLQRHPATPFAGTDGERCA